MPESIGKYKVIKEVGHGATSSVYLVQDPNDGVNKAIKLVKIGENNSMLSTRLKKLFSVEANLAGKLKHPNIVGIYETVIQDDHAYVVMEYVDGPTLEQYCDVGNLLAMHRIMGIIFKCCMALDYAYRNGVIHRDIKPANILLASNDEPKILDFGLALNIGEKDSESTQITGIGSPSYMSPEQIKEHPLNQQTDLYSLGVVLYQLLTGRLPFRGRNSAGLIYKIINAEAPLPSTFRSGIPVELDKIIKKALEKDLYSRYHNGAEFAQDLTVVRYQILDEKDTHAHDLVKFKLLKQLSFFKGFEDPELWEVLRVSTLEKQPAGTDLIKEGDIGDEFYVVAEGQMRITVQGKTVALLSKGDCVGEMAYLNPSNPRRSATVTSNTPVALLRINNAALLLASEECRESFQKTLNLVLIKRLETISQLAAQGKGLEITPSVAEDTSKSVQKTKDEPSSLIDQLSGPQFTLVPMDAEPQSSKPVATVKK